MSKALIFLVVVVPFAAHACGQDADISPETLAKLPGGTLKPLGHLDLEPMEMNEGPRCNKGFIVVPENRSNSKSRNLGLYFYQLKARKPSGKAPVFKLPGGPGGYFDDNKVKSLKTKPKNGVPELIWMFAEDRDVVLVNQRGARLPDRRYQGFAFMHSGFSLSKPFSNESVFDSMKMMSKKSMEYWTGRGMDLSGYEIMNMIEDIEDIRKALGYEKIVLRGTSFGSQWSFAYMQQYPQNVERAILSGIEPLDHGYDSPAGIWNVIRRLETRLLQNNDAANSLQLPKTKLTDAFKEVINRLQQEPVVTTGKHSKRDYSKEVPLGVEDFRRYLRRGVNARRESAKSLEKLPKYIYEIHNNDFSYLACRTIEERLGMSGGHLQLILIDNSLGISDARDKKLNDDPARRWIGEPNLLYKATREVTPTPKIPDSFRTLKTDIPILMVHGDLDFSTPIENAEEAILTLSNSHLIRIRGGTHGAFDQIYSHDPKFKHYIQQFLHHDFSNDQKIGVLGLPDQMNLPELQFDSLGQPSLFEEYAQGN